MTFLRSTIKVVCLWIFGAIFICCDETTVSNDDFSYSDILNCLIMEYH